jgi:hypothetical protein
VTSPISTPEQRKKVLAQAENYLEFGDPGHVADSIIRALMMELAILDGLYMVIHSGYLELAGELNDIKSVIHEDLPGGYMTHRLYALTYSTAELQEMSR